MNNSQDRRDPTVYHTNNKWSDMDLSFEMLADLCANLFIQEKITL